MPDDQIQQNSQATSQPNSNTAAQPANQPAAQNQSSEFWQEKNPAANDNAKMQFAVPTINIADGSQQIAPAVPPTDQTAQQKAKAIAQGNIEMREAEKIFNEGLLSVRDIIAPAAYVINPNYLQLGDVYAKTMFVYTYPRYLEANWLSPIINYDIMMDIGIHVHPLETPDVMKELKNQVGKIQSSMMIAQEKGSPRDPEMETALGDVESLRDVLQRGEVRLFQLGLYFTVYASSLEELNTVVKQLESTLGGMLIYTKETLLQMSDGFIATAPMLQDHISVLRIIVTGKQIGRAHV